MWVRKFHIIQYKTDTHVFSSYSRTRISLWLTAIYKHFPKTLRKVVLIFSCCFNDSLSFTNGQLESSLPAITDWDTGNK